jgi:hypothetical protein
MIKRILQRMPQLVLIILVASISMGGLSSCKSKKKLAREKAQAAYTAKVEQAKKDLTAMLNGTHSWTLEEQSKRLETIESYNIDDPEVKHLIDQVSAKISEAKTMAARKAEEGRLREAEAAKKQAEIERYASIDRSLQNIANATTFDEANQKIEAALHLFATPDIPVLIIISQAEGFNDYDRPTTISKFLEYLKDRKVYPYRVESVKRDNTGKINELELIKK